MKHINTQSKRTPVEHGRGADRFDTALPVEINDMQGLTRNISATGIYFESQVAQEPGSPVHFTVEVSVRGEKLKLDCEGEVVRINRKEGLLGIAAKLKSAFFTDVGEDIDISTSFLVCRH